MRAAVAAMWLAMVAATAAAAEVPGPAEIRDIAAAAYTFAYPLVLMDATRRAFLDSAAGGGGMNHLMNAGAFPDSRFHQVVRPNADTLYSTAWLDLSQQPVLLHVPDTNGRYYLMQLLDGWTDTFAVPGAQTTGTGAGWFAIVGPGWQGVLPPSARRIDSPTAMAWLIGRTQANGPDDFPAVHAIQRGYRLMTLSEYPGDAWGAVQMPPPVPSAARVPPPMRVARLSTAAFFQAFVALLDRNPPHPADAPMMRRLARVGLVPGTPFRPESLGATGWQAFQDGAAGAAERLAMLPQSHRRPRVATCWSRARDGIIGEYGTHYVTRAAVARIGLGALPAEYNVTPSCGQDSAGNAFDGSHTYVLHFAKGRLPPVRAFWSLTLYDADGYFVPNPLNRYAISDRDPRPPCCSTRMARSIS